MTHKERISDYDDLMDMAVDILGAEGGFEWMWTRTEELYWKSPSELVAEGQAEQIEMMLRSMK